MPLNGPNCDLPAPQPSKFVGSREYPEPMVRLEPVGVPMDQRLAAAHEIQRLHNTGDHSKCTADSCAVIAEAQRKQAADTEREKRHAIGDHRFCTAQNCIVKRTPYIG